jgi:pimeloyl-ACP methyl ester carboxylesterase
MTPAPAWRIDDSMKSRFPSLLATVALLSCAAPATVASRPPVAAAPTTPSVASPPAAPVVTQSGALVSSVGGRPIWKETYEVSDHALRSRILRNDGELQVDADWDTGRVVVRHHGEVTSVLPKGGVVSLNGAWQPFVRGLWAITPDAEAASEVPTLLAETGKTITAKARVRSLEDGARRAYLSIDGVVLVIDIDANQQVLGATVPSQDLAVTRGLPKPAPPAQEEEGVEVHPLDLKQESGSLRGELWIPRGSTPTTPVVVMFAGSGPTDRDGNQRMIRPNAYKEMARALARGGIASARFDKRGVGESKDSTREDHLTMRDTVADARLVVRAVRRERPGAPIALAGHSEGALVAMELGNDPGVRSVVLLSGPGRPLGDVLLEQFARKLDAATVDRAREILAAIASGAEVGAVPRPLESIFRPSVRPYVRSMMEMDPLKLVSRIKVPVTIVQGRHDLQVTEADATALGHAAPGAKVVFVAGASHMFKNDFAAGLQISNWDPDLPLAAGTGEALIDGVMRGISPGKGAPKGGDARASSALRSAP